MKKSIIIATALAMQLCAFGQDKTEKYYGDVNNDGQEDLITITTPHDTAHIEIRASDGYEYNFNQPKLEIFLTDSVGRNLFKSYADIIPHPENSNERLSMKLSITSTADLNIAYTLEMAAGSYDVNSHEYTYRFQDGDFFLIAETDTQWSRATGDKTVINKDFVLHKQETIKSNNFLKKKKPKSEWTEMPEKPLEKLGDKKLRQ